MALYKLIMNFGYVKYSVMIEAHKHALFWLAYLVVLAGTVFVAATTGLFGLIWSYDLTFLSTAIFGVWLFTEIVGGVQLVSLSQKITQLKTGQSILHIDADTLWNKHSFVSFMSEIVVAAGIFGTVIGVILALMPFFGLSSFDINTIQPHLLKMFSGIAIAFFPTAISILVKIFLDFHSRLHQNAVIDFLKQQDRAK